MTEKFVDPIDELLARHMNQEELEERAAKHAEENVVEEYVEPVIEVETEIDYGDSDLEDEIRAQEEMEAQERDEMIRKHEEAEQAMKDRITEGPPHPLDLEKTAKTFDFESEKLATVTMMVNQVVAKHHLVSGGIPDDIRFQVMGNLVDMYYRNGEVITPEFEQLILSNWVGNDPTPVMNEPIADEDKIDDNKVVEEKEDKSTTININVEPGTPVTVNIDGEMIDEIDHRREVNVIVHEVDEKEMRSSTIIENSQLEGIITPYESSSTIYFFHNYICISIFFFLQLYIFAFSYLIYL